jgi:hypothetical protein
MKRLSILPGLVLAALSLSAAGTPTHAGERPIRAEGQGILNLSDELDPVLNGVGQGDHLGNYYLQIHLDWYELYTVRDAEVAPYFILIRGSNGDVLLATVDFEFDPATGIVAGTTTFAGGSGRFAGASGSASLLIVPNTSWFYDDGYGHTYPIDQTQFAWALDGTIDY